MSNVIDLLTRQPLAPTPDWEPASGECLACFVRRAIEPRGCTGTLVWAEQWKRVCSPRASALIGRLERLGAACDCGVVATVWAPAADLWEWCDERLVEPQVMPSCLGVRARSTRPCTLWSVRALPVG
jgi:hypothetical protein